MYFYKFCILGLKLHFHLHGFFLIKNMQEVMVRRVLC